MKICLIEYTLKDRWENNTKLSFGGGLLKVSEYIYGKKNLYDDIILSDIIEISLLNISKGDIANEFYLSNKSLDRLLTEIEKDY
ncbi:hypothetical protein SAMN02745135_01093 [Caloranaerobacter azorensis DSM 13643]|uniref:Uncharacterized protein n=1 Tax=Caloranaerobacter azorensis DSM 13643 TaxID=1121264 RepID=A0A1M5TR71_9FIRM|nr:hypothetical protein SAMN02745135_01093 [Caloranaerobacter azorensis DSM 13643]